MVITAARINRSENKLNPLNDMYTRSPIRRFRRSSGTQRTRSANKSEMEPPKRVVFVVLLSLEVGSVGVSSGILSVVSPSSPASPASCRPSPLSVRLADERFAFVWLLVCVGVHVCVYDCMRLECCTYLSNVHH